MPVRHSMPVTVDVDTQWSPEVGNSVSSRRPPPPPPPRDPSSSSSAKDDGAIIPIAAPPPTMRCIPGGPTGAPLATARLRNPWSKLPPGPAP